MVIRASHRLQYFPTVVVTVQLGITHAILYFCTLHHSRSTPAFSGLVPTACKAEGLAVPSPFISELTSRILAIQWSTTVRTGRTTVTMGLAIAIVKAIVFSTIGQPSLVIEAVKAAYLSELPLQLWFTSFCCVLQSRDAIVHC